MTITVQELRDQVTKTVETGRVKVTEAVKLGTEKARKLADDLAGQDVTAKVSELVEKQKAVVTDVVEKVKTAVK